MSFTIRFRRDEARRWIAANPVLAPGEPGYETDTNMFKIGDGTARWTDLRYFHPNDDQALYRQLMEHINNKIAHPVYDDDGPSLFLLYENAKV